MFSKKQLYIVLLVTQCHYLTQSIQKLCDLLINRYIVYAVYTVRSMIALIEKEPTLKIKMKNFNTLSWNPVYVFIKLFDAYEILL